MRIKKHKQNEILSIHIMDPPSDKEDVLEPISEVLPVAPVKIRHIVLSGGGICGFTFYGCLRESHRLGVWDIANIETIYGTSVGAIFAVILSLKPFFTWDELDAFLIKRPWHQIFTFDLNTFLQSIQKCGMFDQKVMEQFLSPLFRAVDISLNITMREFYEKTGIEIHIIATKLVDLSSICKFELFDISHVTHPDWKVSHAVYCSCSLPIVFSPYTLDGNYYIDGGVLCNYPVNPCIQRCDNPDEIFGLSSGILENIPGAEDGEECPPPAEPSSFLNSLIDYILMLFNSMWYKITIKPAQIKHHICSDISKLNIYDMYRAASSEEYRIELIEHGVAKTRDAVCIRALHGTCSTGTPLPL